MKIYVSHSREFDFEEELYKPLRNSPLKQDHTFLFPHENSQDINAQEKIKDSDLVLAEVSFPSTGQGVELGWADMFKIPILCVSKGGNKISSSLRYVTDKFITYADSQDLTSKVSEFLVK